MGYRYVLNAAVLKVFVDILLGEFIASCRGLVENEVFDLLVAIALIRLQKRHECHDNDQALLFAEGQGARPQLCGRIERVSIDEM